jgi:hypothetical protein
VVGGSTRRECNFHSAGGASRTGHDLRRSGRRAQFDGNIGRSTLRLTVAAILFDDICDRMTGDCRLDHEGEAMVSKWMRDHLSLTVAAFADRSALAQVELDVLAMLDPPLNLQHMPATVLRLALKGRRSRVRLAPRSSEPDVQRQTAHSRVAKQPQRTRARTSITLHEEITAILLEHGHPWLTTREIASHANSRGRYIKRDGTPITDFQIHGRTQNYRRLFERRGSSVRLRAHS